MLEQVLKFWLLLGNVHTFLLLGSEFLFVIFFFSSPQRRPQLKHSVNSVQIEFFTIQIEEIEIRWWVFGES